MEADDAEKLNKGNKNANANDMPSAHNCDQIDQENVSDLHDKDAVNSVEVDKVDKANNGYDHTNTNDKHDKQLADNH